MDTGATYHLTSYTGLMKQSSLYVGIASVMLSYSLTNPILHIYHAYLTKSTSLKRLDELVVFL